MTDNCTSDASVSGYQRFSGADLAIGMVFSFVLGIVAVLLVLLVTRLRRQKKLCFKEAEVSSPGKWEGASNSVTTKVIAKHSTLKSSRKGASPENNVTDTPINESISKPTVTEESKPTVTSETEPTIKTESNQTDKAQSSPTVKQRDEQVQEHDQCVSFVQEGKLSDESNEKTRTKDNKIAALTAPAYKHSLNVEELFEDERESSGSHFDFYTLQNNNFGESDKVQVSEMEERGEHNTVFVPDDDMDITMDRDDTPRKTEKL